MDRQNLYSAFVEKMVGMRIPWFVGLAMNYITKCFILLHFKFILNDK